MMSRATRMDTSVRAVDIFIGSFRGSGMENPGGPQRVQTPEAKGMVICLSARGRLNCSCK